MSAGPAVHPTAIPGLLVVDLVVHADDRGWFKESWQREKLVGLGLPDFGPVQHSLAFNARAGVTRGFHAEPWDKLVSLAHGRVFGAWVDLRPGDSHGRVVTLEFGPETAVFVPRGVANAYQVLVDQTVYSYLVNGHWSADATDRYSYLNLADRTVAVDWPIPLAQAIVSAADADHPGLAQARPVPPARTIVIGRRGQLGRALTALLPEAEGIGLPEVDLTRPESLAGVDWTGVGTIINAAGYTDVDAAETAQGRRAAWATNVSGLAGLCRVAERHRATLVHVSSDYVFDGSLAEHDEAEPFSPLGVYGQTKAAGDALVSQLARHYVVRTSWVVGEGRNFVRTMAGLADRGERPEVVADQHGRLTFATDLAAGIVHLLATGAAFGTYNLTNTGPVQTWAGIARQVFALRGRDPDDVRPVTTAQYTGSRPAAPRPPHSTLRLDKLAASGFTPSPAAERLAAYLAGLDAGTAPRPIPR